MSTPSNKFSEVLCKYSTRYCSRLSFKKINFTLLYHPLNIIALKCINIEPVIYKTLRWEDTRFGTFIVATIYLQLIQN